MKNLMKFLGVAGDETRFRIMMLLYDRKLCVCEIHGILGLPQPKVSKHLALLREAGMVTAERSEKFVCYTLKTDDERIHEFLSSIDRNRALYPNLEADHVKLADANRFRCACRPSRMARIVENKEES